MVSGSLSLPSPGFFSPFPHGTSSLSVAGTYSALDRGRPGFGQGSSCPALLRMLLDGLGLRLRGSHALRPAFPCRSADLLLITSQSYNPAHGGLGSSAFARRYLRNLCCFLFPDYLDGSLHPVWPPPPILFGARVHALRHAGYPIRTSADRWICAPPRGLSRLIASFIAARLLWHPPWTHSSLGHIAPPPRAPAGQVSLSL